MMAEEEDYEELTVVQASIPIIVLSMIICGIAGSYYTSFGFWKSALIFGIAAGVFLSLVDMLYRYIVKKKQKPYESETIQMHIVLLLTMIVLGGLGACGSRGFLNGASTNGIVVGLILCVVGHFKKWFDLKQPANKTIVKEEGRYYFYNNHCSFAIDKEDIKSDVEEKDGLKHTLMTTSMMMTILEIRPEMPSLPSSIKTKQVKVAGYPCLAVRTNPIIGDYNQYFIDCKDFVVQVSMTIVSEKFLNSFRIE